MSRAAPGPGVVMLTANFHPHVGGAERQALELSRALSELGARVSVLTRRLDGLKAEETVAGIAVYRTAAWGGGIVNAAVFLASSFLFLLRHARLYDVIHVHLAGSPALAACAAGALLGKGVVVKVGGGRGIGEIALSGLTVSGRLKLALLRMFRPSIVAVTRDLAEELGEFGFGTGTLVIPNGVDVRRYAPVSPQRKADLRRELGWPRGLCFLYVGRFAPEKRLDAFLREYARGLKDAPAGDSFCVFVGSGATETLVRAERSLLALEKKVLMLAPRDSLESVFAAADVFVLPSVSEGLSNALLEGMASGLAVLGSRVGGTKEAVEDSTTGFLFAPEDLNDLREKLVKFLRSPALAGHMGRAASRAAQRDYALEGVARRYLELYSEICSAGIEKNGMGGGEPPQSA